MSLASSIYSKGPSPEPTGRDAEVRNLTERQTLWHKLGVVVIDPATVVDDFARQSIINEANKQYGRRDR